MDKLCNSSPLFTLNLYGSNTKIMRSLHELRLSKGLTQLELSEVSGVHRVLISRVETGRARPNAATKSKLEAVLGRIDFTPPTITVQNPDYLEATKLVERLISITAAMSRKEKKAIRQLLGKHI